MTFVDRLCDADVSGLLANGAGLEIGIHANPAGPNCPAIPLVISDGMSGKAAIFSPTGHYLDYPLLEMGRNSPLGRRTALAALGAPWRAMFRATAFDRVVYVNNWLLNGMPSLDLGHEQVITLIDGIQKKYADHALVFSGTVPAVTPHHARTLTAIGGRAVQSRIVHVLDVRSTAASLKRGGVREKRNVDRRLYEKRSVDRTSDRKVLLTMTDRIRDLYAQLYISKYSSLNPQYTAEFFRLMLESDEFHVAGWFGEDRRLEAFNIRLINDRINHGSLCGYDTSVPMKRGLFRLIAAEDVFGPGDFDLVNWGGGNSAFKRFRGAVPVLEYDVVFDSHLSGRRRFPWRVLREMRGFRNQRAISATGVEPVSAIGSVESQEVKLRKVALITSVPELVAPFLGSDLKSVGIEIPLVVLVRPSTLLGDRLRDLPHTLRRQARLNRTSPLLQLVNRVLYYRLASDRESHAHHALTPGAALDTLARGRIVIDAASANEPPVVSALKEADCELGLVIGADVLTRATLEAIDIPLINLHLSDPAFARGMPPVFWEIHAGRDDVTLTLHRLIARLDAGPILMQRPVPVQWRQTLAGTIAATRRLVATEIARFLTDALPEILEGRVSATIVDHGAVRTIPRIGEVMRARRICRERTASIRQLLQENE